MMGSIVQAATQPTGNDRFGVISKHWPIPEDAVITHSNVGSYIPFQDRIVSSWFIESEIAIIRLTTPIRGVHEFWCRLQNVHGL